MKMKEIQINLSAQIKLLAFTETRQAHMPNFRCSHTLYSASFQSRASVGQRNAIRMSFRWRADTGPILRTEVDEDSYQIES